MEKHNGLITAKSQLGKGASFIMILPLKYDNQNNYILIYEK